MPRNVSSPSMGLAPWRRSASHRPRGWLQSACVRERSGGDQIPGDRSKRAKLIDKTGFIVPCHGLFSSGDVLIGAGFRNLSKMVAKTLARQAFSSGAVTKVEEDLIGGHPLWIEHHRERRLCDKGRRGSDRRTLQRRHPRLEGFMV